MKLYYKIDAPINPLIDNFTFPTEDPPPSGYWIYDSEIVRSEIKQYFSDKLGLNINLAVLFCRLPRKIFQLRENQGVIHSDVTFSNNKWEQMYYAVNWELFNTSSVLSWWETTDVEVYPPLPSIPTNSDLLRGIHYGKRSNLEPLNSNYRRIDSATIDSYPTLVNTACPHSVDYYGTSQKRWALSIRFDKKVLAWEEAVNLFKDIIKT